MTPRNAAEKNINEPPRGVEKCFPHVRAAFLRANRILGSVARAELIRIILRNRGIVPRDLERIAGGE